MAEYTNINIGVTDDTRVFVSNMVSEKGFVEFLFDHGQVTIWADSHAEIVQVVRKAAERLGIGLKDPFDDEAGPGEVG
jgi:hypothetical protein